MLIFETQYWNIFPIAIVSLNKIFPYLSTELFLSDTLKMGNGFSCLGNNLVPAE